MKAYKGLQRNGMRSYKIKGFIITRDRPWRWFVRHERFDGMPMEFFAVQCPSLDAAVRWVRFNGPPQYAARKDFLVDPREALRRARQQKVAP